MVEVVDPWDVVVIAGVKRVWFLLVGARLGGRGSPVGVGVVYVYVVYYYIILFSVE